MLEQNMEDHILCEHIMTADQIRPNLNKQKQIPGDKALIYNSFSTELFKLRTVKKKI